MTISFTKMHGLGNDFVIIDALQKPVPLTSSQIKQMADRHRGIGFDQLLLIEPATVSDADFNYRIFNADGNEVGQCGNGARCIGYYLHQQNRTHKKEITLATKTSRLSVKVEDNQEVSVNFNVPIFEPKQIPFLVEKFAEKYLLKLKLQTVEIGAVSMGNPHAVIQVNKVNTAPMGIAPEIQQHLQFPEQTNVGFMEILDRQHIKLRVYERSAGETLACGSGACAAVAVGRLWNLLDEKVQVELAGGCLTITWPGGQQPLTMTGPATMVFTGEWLTD